MKITVSGWAGAGSSTLSLLLAYSLDLKLLQGGNVFRQLYTDLKFKTEGAERNDAHNFVEPYFGPIYDKFIDEFLKNSDENFIIENDIASFRVGKLDTVFSIFLAPSIESRRKRAIEDGRPESADVMEDIDREHAQKYFELHGIKFNDIDEITKKHQIVIDTTKVTIREELDTVADRIFKFGFIEQSRRDELFEESSELEKLYWEKGKDYFKSDLISRNLYYEVPEILKKLNNLFPNEISKFPKELAEAVQKYA